MNTQFYEWLANMFDEEIKQEQGTIDNELTWAAGSPDQETRMQHRQNADTHGQYLELVNQAKRTILEVYRVTGRIS